MQGLTAFSCAGTNHVLTSPSPPLRKLGAGQGARVPESARGMSLVLLCLLQNCEEAEICWMRAHTRLQKVCFPRGPSTRKGSAAQPPARGVTAMPQLLTQIPGSGGTQPGAHRHRNSPSTPKIPVHQPGAQQKVLGGQPAFSSALAASKHLLPSSILFAL